jgi:hypothetical protein
MKGHGEMKIRTVYAEVRMVLYGLPSRFREWLGSEYHAGFRFFLYRVETGQDRSKVL